MKCYLIFHQIRLLREAKRYWLTGRIHEKYIYYICIINNIDFVERQDGSRKRCDTGLSLSEHRRYKIFMGLSRDDRLIIITAWK